MTFVFSYSKNMTNFEVSSLVNSSSLKPLVCEECADAAGLYRSVSSSNKLTYTMTPLSLSLSTAPGNPKGLCWIIFNGYIYKFSIFLIYYILGVKVKNFFFKTWCTCSIILNFSWSYIFH